MTEDSEGERLRQSERLVDNLKRLYAVLFALSFAVLAAGAAEKITSAIRGDAWTVAEAVVNLEVTVVFALTAGLFYYQSDRFLDITLARRPLPKVTAIGFAFSYLINVLTMAPLYFMAFGLAPTQMSSYGFSLYFIGYLALIINGLFWLIVGDLGRWLLGFPPLLDNGKGLNAFWLVMNSAVLTAVLALFRAFEIYSGPCAAGNTPQFGYSFVFLLGAMILFRDGLDFSHGWAVLVPVPNHDAAVDARPLLAPLARKPWARKVAFVASLVFIVASLWLLAGSGILDFGALRSACAALK